MSIMELGALGEFLGAFGVVITLIYLGVQVRQNNTSTRADTFSTATNAWTEYLQGQSVEDLDLMLTLATEPGVLTHAEFLRVYYLHRLMFRRMENDFYQFRSGTLDEGTWSAYTTSWKYDNFAAPSQRAMWKIQREFFGPEFRAALDVIVEQAPPTPPHFRREFTSRWEAEIRLVESAR